MVFADSTVGLAGGLVLRRLSSFQTAGKWWPVGPPSKQKATKHTHTQKKNTRTRYIGRWSFYLGFLFQGAVYRDPDSGYIGQY